MKYFPSRLVAVGAVTLLTLSSSATAQELTEITVGVSTAMFSAPVFLAQENGIFAKHGLTVEVVTLQSGAEAVPNLMNGTFDISMGDPVGTTNAILNGVPLKIVGNAIVAPEDPEFDFSAILAKPDTIESLADLSGKTFAVHQQGGATYLNVLAAIDKAGGDASTVNFVEIALPQIPSALAQGAVDAGMVAEPFVTIASKLGLEVISRPLSEAMPNFPMIFYISAAQTTSKRGDAINAFLDAMDEANALAVAEPERTREILGKSTPIPAPILAEARLPVSFPESTRDFAGLSEYFDQMVEYEAVKSRPDIDEFVWSSRN